MYLFVSSIIIQSYRYPTLDITPILRASYFIFVSYEYNKEKFSTPEINGTTLYNYTFPKSLSYIHYIID